MKKNLFITLLALLSFIMIGCSKPTDYSKYEGIYDLDSATLDGVDITSDYYMYQIELSTNQKMSVKINYLGILTSRQSTYVIEYPNLKETSNNGDFNYVFKDETTLETSLVEYGETLVVTLKKLTDEDDIKKAVEFESILFGESINDTKKFNYAPSIILDMNDQNEQMMHIWYCTNLNSGVIMDHIGYRKGVLNKNGKWEFSEEEIVLAPTLGTWDGRHVCDPSVVRGTFQYNNEVYSYMMSYLGCTTEDYSNNETGIAVAKSPEGPWVKLDHLNPIVPYSTDNPSGAWGTGMPAMISVDKEGEVLLFYSNSAVGTSVEHWDFSNLNTPARKFKSTIKRDGAKNPNGSLLWIAIADFAYDEKSNRLYMVSSTNAKDPEDITRTRVNSHAAVAYIENLNSMDDLLDALRTGNYTWKMHGYVSPDDTGFTRNHNLGIVRNEYGIIEQENSMWVVVSTGHNDWPNENIFTYRLRGHIIDFS